LKDDRFLLVRTEVRINYLDKSETFKIIQSTSTILCSVKGETKSAAYLMSRSINARANRHLALGATLHDRIPARRARCGHLLDQSYCEASRDPL
jgi:hypothetical protein